MFAWFSNIPHDSLTAYIFWLVLATFILAVFIAIEIFTSRGETKQKAEESTKTKRKPKGKRKGWPPGGES